MNYFVYIYMDSILRFNNTIMNIGLLQILRVVLFVEEAVSRETSTVLTAPSVDLCINGCVYGKGIL